MADAERTTLAEQLRARGAEQAARDEKANAFHAQRRADEAEANGEYVDYAEAAAVREIEREMAIEAGDDSELDRQVAEDDARNERNYEAHQANEAWLDAHPDDYEAEDGFTTEQLNGNACSVCGGGFKIGEASQPSGYVLDHGQLFAHTACLDESEA